MMTDDKHRSLRASHDNLLAAAKMAELVLKDAMARQMSCTPTATSLALEDLQAAIAEAEEDAP